MEIKSQKMVVASCCISVSSFEVSFKPHRNVLPEFEVRQPGVLGLVDNDAVAGLVNIVVQAKIGRNPIGKVVNHNF